MKIPLAWHNTFQNKKRTLAAIGGISFSLPLIFMQLGFLTTARITAGLVYDYFDYDLIITSAAYESMDEAGSFDKARLVRARVVPGVENVTTLNYQRVRWRDPARNYLSSSSMLLGYDLNPAFIRDEEVKSNLNRIKKKDTVMLDLYSHPDYGEKKLGLEYVIGREKITIAAFYKLGISFHASGSVIVNLDTFQHLTGKSPRHTAFANAKPAERYLQALLRGRAMFPYPRRCVLRSKRHPPLEDSGKSFIDAFYILPDYFRNQVVLF